MMIQKEDLGLSLSLSFPQNHHSLQLNLTPPTTNSSSFPFASGFSLQKTSSWSHHNPSPSDPSSELRAVEGRSFLRGIDVNRLPATADYEEEAGVSSPNSTISSISGKRSEREAINGDDNDTERACSRGISDEEDGDTSRKKLRLSKDQSAILEESFKEHNTLNPKQKLALAKQLGLRPRQVEVWFQNRRARTKLKQTEVDCEFLKRCCENLTEENSHLLASRRVLACLSPSPFPATLSFASPSPSRTVFRRCVPPSPASRPCIVVPSSPSAVVHPSSYVARPSSRLKEENEERKRKKTPDAFYHFD